MPKNYSKPERMCISCRSKMSQELMLRLQCRDHTLSLYSGKGRSFYICEECFFLKQTSKSLMRECKCGDYKRLLIELKEIIVDVRQS